MVAGAPPAPTCTAPSRGGHAPHSAVAVVAFDAVFFAVVRGAVDFLAAVFLAAAFFAGAFFAALGVVFLAGPRVRLSASSSAARSRVIDSGSSSLRRVALTSPSVTYGPKRPSLTSTDCPDAGSVPSSRSGAWAWRPRRFGSA